MVVVAVPWLVVVVELGQPHHEEGEAAEGEDQHSRQQQLGAMLLQRL